MSQKRTRKLSGMDVLPSAMNAVRAASRGDLEDLLEKLMSKDSELGAYVVDELTAVRAPAKPRVAETSTLTVGGTGAFDALNESLLLDVLLGLEPYKRLEAMSACKGWLALRKDPTFWPALRFETRQVSSSELPGGRRGRSVSARTLNKFFVGPRAILPPMTNLVTLDVHDSTSNKHGIGASDWSALVKNLRVPPGQLRELIICGKVFKITFYKACAKLFGAGLRELRVGPDNGGTDWDCMSALLSSCPRLAKLTIPAGNVACIRFVSEELQKARGGGASLLESLTIDAEKLWNNSDALRPDEVFSTVQRHFPELVELRTRLTLDLTVASSQLSHLKRLAIHCRCRGGEETVKLHIAALARTIATTCPKLESLDVDFYFTSMLPMTMTQILPPLPVISAASAFLAALGEHNKGLRELKLRDVEIPKANVNPQTDPSVIAALVNDAPGQITKLDIIVRASGTGEIDGMTAEAANFVAEVISSFSMPRPNLRVRVGYKKPGRTNCGKRFYDQDATLRWLLI